jgi:hypothetical protein
MDVWIISTFHHLFKQKNPFGAEKNREKNLICVFRIHPSLTNLRADFILIE